MVSTTKSIEVTIVKTPEAGEHVFSDQDSKVHTLEPTGDSVVDSSAMPISNPFSILHEYSLGY